MLPLTPYDTPSIRHAVFIAPPLCLLIRFRLMLRDIYAFSCCAMPRVCYEKRGSRRYAQRERIITMMMPSPDATIDMPSLDYAVRRARRVTSVDDARTPRAGSAAR